MSVKEILMPKLGESVTEGTITTWLVEEGEVINKYDPIAEVMTDKVNAEIPSSFSGTITKIVAEEGDVKAVGDLICYIEIDQTSATSTEFTTNKETAQKETTGEKELTKTKDQSMKKRYSPAVLQLANEHNIELTELEGTGLGGRITRKDIKQFINNGKPKTTKLTDSRQQQEKLDITSFATSDGDIEIPVTGVRKAIAHNMKKAKQEIPHAWMTVEADVTGLVRYREKLKADFKRREGYALTYFSFFIHAVARALKEFPQLNSVWAGDKIIQRKDIHISIAVAKENELFVPVIKHADEKSVQGIARDIATLATKARNNQLTAEDMAGGTFTVNNTGTFGSVSSMGIINHPQAAILQVESIIKRPVISDDMFAARDMVNLSLSLDHRILDGLICGRFLSKVKEILESMDETSTII